jgi:hypothetical protein
MSCAADLTLEGARLATDSKGPRADFALPGLGEDCPPPEAGGGLSFYQPDDLKPGQANVSIVPSELDDALGSSGLVERAD